MGWRLKRTPEYPGKRIPEVLTVDWVQVGYTPGNWECLPPAVTFMGPLALTYGSAVVAGSLPVNLLAIAAVGAGAGLYLFYRGFCLLQRKRLILNTPASKIRSASMGLVEVNGVAKGPYVI